MPSKAIWLIVGFSTTVMTSRPASGITVHVLEEPGVEEVAHREVQLLGRHRLAGLDAGEDPDGVGLDALVAGDVDPAEDRGALGERRAASAGRRRPARR